MATGTGKTYCIYRSIYHSLNPKLGASIHIHTVPDRSNEFIAARYDDCDEPFGRLYVVWSCLHDRRFREPANSRVEVIDEIHQTSVSWEIC